MLSMEGGISISEDPNLRFTYVSNGAKRFRAEAKDTDGHVFRNEWDVEKPGTRLSIVMAGHSRPKDGSLCSHVGITDFAPIRRGSRTSRA